MHKIIGKHLLVECKGISPSFLENVEVIESIFKELIQISGLTLLSVASHQFKPSGATLVMLLSESHLSAHTWPEFGAMTLDLFSCNPDTPFEAFITHLQNAFQNPTITWQLLDRTIPESHA